MRHYFIFLIQDEIARSYFGRESKLYQLFLEADNIGDYNMKQQINKQVEYITKRIPVFKIGRRLELLLSHLSEYKCCNQIHMIEHPKKTSQAQLELGTGRLSLKATGDYSAETSFFEVLRQIDDSFLAIDFKHHRFGWLKPIKNAHLI
ncbi:sporulation inhibitor of replication protein SirA [Scopulibacillus cellulosilyticus]|uniref:Sporulation inhibitor of replication protein SirA n=1 Tax=Scopulibacillus cellulosilyticus TaxID=2665665 RepID=A0ABW2PVK6_9BACL